MKNKIFLSYLLILLFCITGCVKENTTTSISVKEKEPLLRITDDTINTDPSENPTLKTIKMSEFDIDDVPAYSGSPYCVINDNHPFFAADEIANTSFEDYPDLDNLGRCQTCTACLSKDTMPAENEKREEIGMIKPAGWHTVKYENIIEDRYLYNRCHLIGWQLGNENANPNNLTTGTRYLNVKGMLPFENQVANYIKETNNHVMYRITPVFIDNELVCRGILMEALSVEDDGCIFCVYCYNVQPGITIDYTTGNSYIEGDENEASLSSTTKTTKYIINTKTKKIHRPDCDSVKNIKDSNKQEYSDDIENLINDGYTRCKNCNPD